MNIIKYLVLLISSLFLLTKLHAASINVYLKCDEPKLIQSLRALNNYLERHHVFDKYQIHPFLNQHPLHLSLYLATYSDDTLPEIKKRVAEIAKIWAPVSIKTSKLLVTEGNYVMLDVANVLIDGNNAPLQQLSDWVTINLNLLRDSSAKIPDWVQSNPEKRKAFERYGSPNVFVEFSPHFSLMAKLFSDSGEAKAFRQELTALLSQYPFPELTIQSVALGIGYVDNFGQITKELASYPLRSR
jgi:hypothetical protein